jgi:hypothetical protein
MMRSAVASGGVRRVDFGRGRVTAMSLVGPDASGRPGTSADRPRRAEQGVDRRWPIAQAEGGYCRPRL